ncbi:magnesium transporter [Caloramator quimbayensis]|uniref:Magnesium transporter n=1 Tax=Caloramator quimbayensis TaxID=1147123 RepID=A0A1T4X2G6_9CLOT|nr:magnesium transporter CorA family protein [Caloramator quimbayensis]SKA83784.1 magnesium transporter [Caloramator quimbayensis]
MNVYSIDNEVNKIEHYEIDFNSKCFYWIDMNPEELKKNNKNLFNFEYDTLSECESVSQFAKVDFYDNYTFLVLNSLKHENGVVKPDEFNIFLGKNYIVTVSKNTVKILNELQDEIINYKNSIFFSKEKSPSKFLYYILDRLILNDYEIINKLENTADALEIQMMKNPDGQFLQALLHLRHQVHTLRRCVAPLRYIGDNLLCNENNIIEKECIRYFNQINLKIDKLMFSLESLIQYIVLVREAFEAEIANKTNGLMKLFTIIAMFFSPLTLITGIYGMNFKIPEYSWKYGYFYSLFLMAFISAGLFVYFKRKKWL